MCFYYVNVLMTTFLTIFRRFPTTLRGFQNLFQNFSQGQTNVSEYLPNILRRLLTIHEDYRRRPKKIQRCFDRTLTNSSVVEGARGKFYQT